MMLHKLPDRSRQCLGGISLVALAFLVVVVTLSPCPSTGQHLISTTTDWQRANLVEAWRTQVETFKPEGREIPISFHISRTETTREFEVVHPGGIQRFSAGSVDRYGVPMTESEASQQADLEKRILESKGIEAKIVTHVTPRVSIYVQTDRSVLLAIDGKTGKRLWSRPTGRPDFPNSTPVANDEFAAVINGSTLYVIGLADGKLVFERRLDGPPGAGPAISDSFVFVPLMSGLVEAYRLDEKERRRTPIHFSSIGGTHVTPTVSSHSISWPTDRGYLYVADAKEGRVRFRLEARSELVAHSVHLDPHRLLAASTDGYLFCVNELNGRMLWQFSAGEALTSAPVAVGEQVFVVSDQDRLFAVDAERGIQSWMLEGVRSVASVSERFVYAVGVRSELFLVDRESGTIMQTILVREPGMFVPNLLTDRLYFVSPSGELTCLHERDRRRPLIHIDLSIPGEATKENDLAKANEKAKSASSAAAEGSNGATASAAKEPAKEAEEGDVGLFEDADDIFGGSDDELFGDQP